MTINTNLNFNLIISIYFRYSFCGMFVNSGEKLLFIFNYNKLANNHKPELLFDITFKHIHMYIHILEYRVNLLKLYFIF